MAAPNASPVTPAVTPERIMQFAWGYIPPLALEAGIRHRIFDVLDEGPKTVEEVHGATGASVRGLSAVMNALVGLNFLAKDAQGVYSLTAESAAFLVSTKPGFQGGIIKHTSEQLLPKYLKLNEIVATGKPAVAVNQEAAGAEFFEQFVVDIFPMSYPSAQVLAKTLDFDAAGRPVSVLDLAEGAGGRALAQRAEPVTGTAGDWPEGLPVPQKTVGRCGLGDRFSFVEGDLLVADFGTGHNVATLGHIVHSEGEERSRKLLAKVFAALASGGTIAIAEFLVDEDRRGPVSGLFFAVNMLVNTDNGGTYSFAEISAWLAETGFVNARMVPAPGPSPLILATKP